VFTDITKIYKRKGHKLRIVKWKELFKCKR